jgi:hypothetical protein
MRNETKIDLEDFLFFFRKDNVIFSFLNFNMNKLIVI